MEHLFHNLNFWLVLAFLIALILFAKKIYKMINDMLANQINHIARDIQESKKVYTQSFSLITEKKEHLKSLITYKNKFLTTVKHKADTYYEKLLNKLDQNLHNSKKGFNDYLEHMEKNLIKKESDHILEKSIHNVKEIIQDNTQPKDHKNFIDDSIKNIATIIAKNNGK